MRTRSWLAVARWLAVSAVLAVGRSLCDAELGVASTSGTLPVRLEPLAWSEVRWTRGFWADRFELCRREMIPGLWRLMEGTNYSQYFENFRIAAGLAEGRPRGAPFNDGDFYKWLEGACAVYAVTRDPDVERLLEGVEEVIVQAQRADGYLHTPVLIRQRNGDRNAQPFQSPLSFETYNFGHLFTAAAAHFCATGRTNLLSVARKAADFLEATFRRPTPELARCSICPSHYMGLVELFRVTREPRYLELVKTLFSIRDLIPDGSDDNQDRIPFQQQTNAMGHAVRANYLYAGAADLFAETGDRAWWKPLLPIWTNVVQQKMYLTGGCGALYDGASPDAARNQRVITRVHQAYGRNYQLPNLAAHNETCANIGNVLWNWRMFLVTGEARFMDVVELALYNSVLSGVGLDGTNSFYVNPLRQVEPLPTELRWPRTRVPYVSSFCCPPNLARTIAESAQYAYAKSDAAVWVNLYGGSTLRTKWADGQVVELTQETDYPWNGRVRFTIKECGGDPFSLKLRMPGWAHSARLRLNGLPVEVSPTPGAYFELYRAWRAGDIVDLDIPMPLELIEANPLVEETLNQVAIKRGPVVYCLESPDLPPGVRVLDVALSPTVDLVPRFDARLLGGVVIVDGRAWARPAESWDGRLYRKLKLKPAKPITARFIPYFAWANRGQSEMTVWLPLAAPSAP